MIYSARFAAGIAASGTTTSVYTAPAGYTTVIRSVDLIQETSGSGVCILVLHGIAYLVTLIGSAVYQQEHWEGRQVLNAGDSLDIVTSGQGFSYVISGYNLQ